MAWTPIKLRKGGEISFVGESEGGGGGSQPGAARVIAFPFAFDTVGLADGVPIYVPSVNDVLLDAWFEIVTTFDGTDPRADISQYNGSGSPYGLYADSLGAVKLDQNPDTPDSGGGPLAGSSGAPYQPLSLMQTYNTFAALASASVTNLTAFRSDLVSTFGGGAGLRTAPARFSTADPLLLVVTQEGTKGGTPIDSMAGEAIVYIVVATPA